MICSERKVSIEFTNNKLLVLEARKIQLDHSDTVLNSRVCCPDDDTARRPVKVTDLEPQILTWVSHAYS